VVGWNWDFGGTGTSTAQNPSHTFPAGGRYSITLTVTDDDGGSGVRSREVRVEAPPPPNQTPVAAFTWECDELECDFEDESSDSDGRIETRVWNFGDGNGSDERNPDHTYTTSGTYQVTLTVTDNDGAPNSVTQAVTVAAPPPAPTSTTTSITDDSPDPSGPGQPITVSFTVTSIAGTPGGTVTVTDGVDSCTGELAGGSGSCPLALTTSGPRTLTATYQGGSDFTGSVGTASHTVTEPAPASTTTAITSISPEPSDPGQQVVVSFTVTADAGTPAGTVTVGDGVDSCAGDLNGGSGSCSLLFIAPGPHTITANYQGNPGFDTSFDTETHTVNELPTGALGLRT
jgi:PKD repeat protein